MAALRALCDKHGILLIADEVRPRRRAGLAAAIASCIVRQQELSFVKVLTAANC
jgi:glutamate-1-semialdehyde aminotransferase